MYIKAPHFLDGSHLRRRRQRKRIRARWYRCAAVARALSNSLANLPDFGKWLNKIIVLIVQCCDGCSVLLCSMVLQCKWCTTVQCSACIALHCTVVQYIAIVQCSILLQGTAGQCSAVYCCSAVHCIALSAVYFCLAVYCCTAVYCNNQCVQFNAALYCLCNTVLHCNAHCVASQHSTLLHCITYLQCYILLQCTVVLYCKPRVQCGIV